MTTLEKILAALKPSIKIVQTFAPLAPGPSKTNAVLALIAAFAGTAAGIPLPGKYTQVTAALIALTVSELQESGEMVKDQVPIPSTGLTISGLGSVTLASAPPK